MQNLLNPKWLLIVNTMPMVILFVIFVDKYQIINSLLSEESISLWKQFGLTLALLGLLNFCYAVFLIFKQKMVSKYYGIFVLSSYIPFLYLYGHYSGQIIPFSIPQWMIPTDLTLYVGTFLMPTLIYCLFILIIHLTPDNQEQETWKNFLIAILVPITWYFFLQIVLPLWQPIGSNFGTHAIIIFLIIGTVIFLFFLIRGIYILSFKKTGFSEKYEFVWKIPIAIIFPWLGLAVNNNIFDLEGSQSGVFGNFHHHWFYILAVLNGIFICLPNLENQKYRLLLFIGRNLTFPYTVYFFLVFLPFLPLSTIAIIAAGTGFLMLTPLVLLVIHVNELSKDVTFLRTYFHGKLIGTVAILSFLVLPVLITATYLNNRAVLKQTLAYLYHPDYSKAYHIDRYSLLKTLTVVKQYKERNRREIFFGNQIPYLSAYFNWLVLDNLTLSNAKIAEIEKVFFGKTTRVTVENSRSDKMVISKIGSSSRFDKRQNAWISWVDLEITNNSGHVGLSEYATTVELPVGCWISDYYLYVGNRKEMGILAEKRAAMWVFSQIRHENRDPGILYYLTDRKVAFKIFPFMKDEVRKTGIEFIHKEPVTLTIDNHTLVLGNDAEQNEISVVKTVDNNVVYISAQEKLALNQVQRTPYYHFLVDVSKGQEKFKGEFINRIETLLDKNFISKNNAKICFVNAYTFCQSLNDPWKRSYHHKTYEGGFYLDRAIRTTLFNAYKRRDSSYPIIVVVTDHIRNAIIGKDFTDLKIAFPESDWFYNLNRHGELKPHSLIVNPYMPVSNLADLQSNHPVFAYPSEKNPLVFLRNDSEPSIVLKNDLFTIDAPTIKEKNWQSALIMQGQWMSQVLHPEISDKEWLNLIKYSFKSKVMTPMTSYLVVENEAQKAILKRKQAQVLSGNKLLDLGDSRTMSEPNLILLVVLFGIVFLLRKKFT